MSKLYQFEFLSISAVDYLSTIENAKQVCESKNWTKLTTYDIAQFIYGLKHYGKFNDLSINNIFQGFILDEFIYKCTKNVLESRQVPKISLKGNLKIHSTDHW